MTDRSDIKCLCASGASGAFHDAIASCLLSNCTANDVTAVKAFEAKMCGSCTSIFPSATG